MTGDHKYSKSILGAMFNSDYVTNRGLREI